LTRIEPPAMHLDTTRDPSAHPTGQSPTSQALASVTRRLYTEFQPNTTMAEVLTIVQQCRHDLDVVTDPALPEFVERLARQRLSNRHAAHRHKHH
jgi:hypothetical protein